MEKINDPYAVSVNADWQVQREGEGKGGENIKFTDTGLAREGSGQHHILNTHAVCNSQGLQKQKT